MKIFIPKVALAISLLSLFTFTGCGPSENTTQNPIDPAFSSIDHQTLRTSFAKLIMDKQQGKKCFLPNLETKNEMWDYTHKWKKITLEYEDIVKFRSYTGLEELKGEMTSIKDTLRRFYCENTALCELSDKQLFNIDSNAWMSEPQILNYRDNPLGFAVVKHFVKKGDTDSLRYKPNFILYSAVYSEDSWKFLLIIDKN